MRASRSQRKQNAIWLFRAAERRGAQEGGLGVARSLGGGGFFAMAGGVGVRLGGTSLVAGFWGGRLARCRFWMAIGSAVRYSAD